MGRPGHRPGTVIDTAGFVLTAAAPVVTKTANCPDKLRCRLANGRAVAATVVGFDPAYNLALLRIPRPAISGFAQMGLFSAARYRGRSAHLLERTRLPGGGTGQRWDRGGARPDRTPGMRHHSSRPSAHSFGGLKRGQAAREPSMMSISAGIDDPRAR